MTALPKGFVGHVGSAGVKDSTDDVMIVASRTPCTSSAVFTQSRFAGPSVEVSRENAAHRSLQCAVVISKNANVATGPAGLAHAHELVEQAARVCGVATYNVLVASTGVIGRPYPIERLRAHFDTLTTPLANTDAESLARAIMTTDTVAKVAHAAVTTQAGGTASIVGIAKGVGMIEPNMATMIALVFTDAAVAAAELDAIFGSVVADTFNALSVDSDTSTSDTAAVMASGAAGSVDLAVFEAALREVCTSLTRQLARDGEGATKLLIAEVSGARDIDQARRVAKLIINSPLVKTAVHGADPNWGRVAMAVGKAENDIDIEADRVRISFGELELYPTLRGQAELDALSSYLKGEEVVIRVDLGIADSHARAYGCDLSDQYVRINADYTT